MENKFILVRDSIAGKGLELAKDLLSKKVKVMINGPEQEAVIETMQALAKDFCAELIFGVPGNIMSVEEYEKFYSNPKISEVVEA